MNFYNKGEKKEGAPVMPSVASPFRKTSAFGKTPLLSRAAGSITDRLKKLSRRDMALVSIGLSVLVMAPVAEYMMSQPLQDNALTSGWGDRGKRDSGPYEPGINGLSQGSSDGSGEVITPLSSRDPASLILGSQPAAPAALPPSAPLSSGFRDALKESGRAAFSEASKSAGAPTVIPRLQSSLRSVSSFGGGEGTRTSGSLGGGKIIENAQSASSKPNARTMVGPVASAGYKGVSNTPNSASRGAFEKLRMQGDKSAGNFNGESAIRSLDRAAADSANIGRGAGGMGAGGESETTAKNPNSNIKNEHQKSGESLEDMAAKMRMQKALEWEFFKKYELPKQFLTAVVGAFSNSVAKFVSDTTEGVLLGRESTSNPTYICVQKIDSAKECQPGNMRAAFRSSDPKTVDAWINKGTCGCGPMTSGEFSQANGDAPAPAPAPVPAPEPAPAPAPAPGPAPAAGPAPNQAPLVKETFANYDGVLQQMFLDVQEGVKTKDAGELLTRTIAIAAGCPNLKVDAVINAVKNGSAAAREGGIADYERSISDAEMQIAAVKSDYQMFKSKFDNVLKAAREGKLVVGSSTLGEKSSTIDISKGVLPYLEKAETTLTAYETDFIAKADTKLAFNSAALKVFRNQLGYVEAGVDNLSKDYQENVLKLAQEMSSQLDAIKNAIPESGKPTGEQQVKIAELFKSISGYDSSVGPAASAGAKLDPDALALNMSGIKDFRDSVGAAAPVPAGGAVPLMEKLAMWRGLPKDEPFIQEGANDGAASKTEQSAWAVTTPLQKASISQIVDQNNLAPESLLAGLMRGGLEVPGDTKASLIDPKAAAGLLQPVKDKMSEVRTQLVDVWKINMDNPTGGAAHGGTGGAGGTPAADSGPTTSERKNGVLAKARLTGSEYDAATTVNKGLGNSRNAQYAKADYKNMTASKAEIDRITGEMSAPNARASKKRLDDLELHTANFNKAYSDFQTHAAVAAKPQIIINNSVQGGQGGSAAAISGSNSNAASNASSKPSVTVVNSNSNNNANLNANDNTNNNANLNVNKNTNKNVNKRVKKIVDVEKEDAELPE